MNSNNKSISRDGIKCDAIIMGTKKKDLPHQCNKQRTIGDYCNTHQFYNNFNEDNINVINLGNAKYCGGCEHPFFEPDNKLKKCSPCKIKDEIRNDVKQSTKPKCKWTSGKHKKCYNTVVSNGLCKRHLTKDYTKDQFNKIKFCGGLMWSP